MGPAPSMLLQGISGKASSIRSFQKPDRDPRAECWGHLLLRSSPSAKEASLSNKGALSTWRIHEVADLNSIVETIWKKGAVMSTADPLSRLARREDRLNNLDLPLLMGVLFKRLPNSIREAKHLRVNAERIPE
jgi:hypothetical protein